MVLPLVMWLTVAADTVRAPVDPTSAPPAPAAGPVATPTVFGTAQDPQQQRKRKSVEYSEWYGRRLTLHRYASYSMLPLFAAEYYYGNKLLNDAVVAPGTRNAHSAIASGIGVLFGVNTATGLWNLWDARNDPNGRTKRIVHSALLLAADAGFLYTASLAGDDGREGEGGSYGGNRSIQHRNAALVSIGLSTVGTGLMWFFKD